MRLTDPVLDDLRRAGSCWFATADARGRPHMGARDAWATLGAEAVVLADTLSPATARNLRLNPWAVAGFLDETGRHGWRIEGPARTLAPGEAGFADAALHLVATGAARPKRILHLTPVRVERIATPEMPLIPDRAAKGLALIRQAAAQVQGLPGLRPRGAE
ncbi:pyridoxamine 5'-phosphate oxidase family protein [Rubellimicrobium roseum]|uniref:Pyridoxamine 5'-phosphate oxidase family protein n=1 Tax=Rubellimicrobium roseum TaxID=687525 RepID=A0A5C4NC97_9RHOB|nr:pyridoxamine 5'-phosphate oxidase family protein [Rubellimicrobium roseum]TNC72381.1 pyridoxamine 5'-phosphate oxidase family protein [Rubellimicrobium roseum]